MAQSRELPQAALDRAPGPFGPLPTAQRRAHPSAKLCTTQFEWEQTTLERHTGESRNPGLSRHSGPQLSPRGHLATKLTVRVLREQSSTFSAPSLNDRWVTSAIRFLHFSQLPPANFQPTAWSLRTVVMSASCSVIPESCGSKSAPRQA